MVRLTQAFRLKAEGTPSLTDCSLLQRHRGFRPFGDAQAAPSVAEGRLQPEG
jgi:hypothetical protein